MRKPEWKQETPKDQLKVLLWSIEGELDNLLENAIGNRKAALLRAIAKLEEVRQLAAEHVPDGAKWKP